MHSRTWRYTLLVILAGLGVTTISCGSKTEPAGVKDKLDPPQRAVVVLSATKGYDVEGTIHFMQKEEGVHLSGEIRNLKPGKHGFHIHMYGDLTSSDGTSAGGHYNPKGHRHGGPDDEQHHVGDLGNITANESGVAKVDKMVKGLKLHFVIGRSLVVHGDADDLKSQPSGSAGPRVGLGVIGIANPKTPTKK